MTTIAERLRTNPAIPEEMALMDKAADALDAAEKALDRIVTRGFSAQAEDEAHAALAKLREAK
jgi:hypothetical protein